MVLNSSVESVTMNKPKLFVALIPFILLHCISSGGLQAQARTIYLTNKCPFSIWPATAPNQGQPVIAKGGFYLQPGHTESIPVPGTWSGRVWARTGCKFDYNWKPACETGDCDGQYECNGKIGLPPVTLVELTLQVHKKQPSFYDVSLVDGYNLPVSVTTKPAAAKCSIGGCEKNLNSICPKELQVLNEDGEVVACNSACLAFNADNFCCKNYYGTPEKCKPNMYSKIFKEACPHYLSYAFDKPEPLANCVSDEYVITFCPTNSDQRGKPT